MTELKQAVRVKPEKALLPMYFIKGRLQPKSWDKLAGLYRSRRYRAYVVREGETGYRTIESVGWISIGNGGIEPFTVLKLVRKTKTRVVIWRVKAAEYHNGKELGQPTEERLMRLIIRGV